MNFITKTLSGLIGLLILPMYVTEALASDESETEKVAKSITVAIVTTGLNGRGRDLIGSGVIITQKEGQYYLLTNDHVISANVQYFVLTADGIPHQLEIQEKHKENTGVDIAEAVFTVNNSEKSYQSVSLGQLTNLSKDSPVYLAGWPTSRETEELQFKFERGRITSDFPLEVREDLLYDTRAAECGMSGGPVLNQNGQLVAIHFEGIPLNPNDPPQECATRFRGGKGVSLDTIRETVTTEEIKAALDQPPIADSNNSPEEEPSPPKIPDEPKKPIPAFW